jgi:hypothetical protein
MVAGYALHPSIKDGLKAEQKSAENYAMAGMQIHDAMFPLFT